MRSQFYQVVALPPWQHFETSVVTQFFNEKISRIHSTINFISGLTNKQQTSLVEKYFNKSCLTLVGFGLILKIKCRGTEGAVERARFLFLEQGCHNI